MVNINDSVMVPLGPPKVITAAERQRSGVILRRWPEIVSRATRSMAAIQKNRSAITTRVTSRIMPISTVLLIYGSDQLALMARGSCMPRRMNTAPLSEKLSTPHTEVETIFVRATFGPTPVRSNRMNRPAATTDRMPDTLNSSAPKYSRKGRNSSIRIRVVVVSQPRDRTVSNSQLAAAAITRPNKVPPKKEITNSPAACPTANSPVKAAARANWKPTMPEASLKSDSPFSTLR